MFRWSAVFKPIQTNTFLYSYLLVSEYNAISIIALLLSLIALHLDSLQGGHSSMPPPPPQQSTVGILASAILQLERRPFPIRDEYARTMLTYLGAQVIHMCTGRKF